MVLVGFGRFLVSFGWFWYVFARFWLVPEGFWKDFRMLFQLVSETLRKCSKDSFEIILGGFWKERTMKKEKQM